MANKKTTLKEKDHLQSYVGGAVVDNKSFNDLGNFSKKREAVKNLFLDMDSQQFCSRFKWKGVPDYLYFWRVEQMLYNRGSVAIFKLANRFYILPYAMSKELNPYGLPTGITPTTYNGSILNQGEKEKEFLTYELPVSFDGAYNPEAKAVILYDRINGFVNAGGLLSRFALIHEIIDELADRFKYLKINLRNSQGKLLILVRDSKQAEAVREAITSMYENTDNFEIVKSMYETQVINNDVKFMGQEIWEDIASFNALRLESLGYSNTGLFNKKERTIEKEIQNTGSSAEALLQSALDSRKLFVEQCKALFGSDPDFQRDFAGFDVELNIPETEEQQPADEMTEEEKGQEGEINE